MKLLRRLRDLVDRRRHQCETCEHEYHAGRSIPARVAREAAASGRCRIGRDEYRFERMVDPLTQAVTQNAEREDQGMHVRDSVHLDGGRSAYARCPECGDELVPIIKLEPGLRFNHVGTSGAMVGGVKHPKHRAGGGRRQGDG